MTILKQTAFTGAVGATPTAANTGFDSLNDFGSFVFVSSPTINGSAYQVSSTTSQVLAQFTSLSATEHYGRAFIYQTALNSTGSNQNVIQVRSSAGEIFDIGFVGGGTGAVFINSNTGARIWTSTTDLAINTWYRIEWHHVASIGSVQVRLYVGNSTTVTEDSTALTVSTAVATVASVQIVNGVGAVAYLGDGNAIGDGAGGWLGPTAVSFTATGSLTLGATGAMRAPLTGTGLLSLAASGSAVAAPGAIHGTAAITLAGSGTTKAAVAGGAALSLSGVASGITSHTNVAGTGIVSLAASGLIAVKTTAHALLALAAAAILAVYRDIQVSVIYGKDRWSVMTAGVMTVEVTAGGREFAWGGLTEVNGSDISADTVQVSLGSQLKSGTWNTPDSVSFPIPSQVIAKKLIDNTVAPGTYWLWIKLTDTPETVVRSSTQVIVH